MIQLNHVEKEYRGGLIPRAGRGVRALDGVTLTAQRGEALGLIGLNGAGKSTLLRLLLGYVRPTAGTVTVDDLAPREFAERHGIAYVPEHVRVPGGWTVRGALTAYAMLGELDDDALARVEQAMERLGLTPLAERAVRRLSKGNLQRLAIAQAILGDRQLMVLDEPTDGLDPVWIAELRRIVEEWRAVDAGRTLVIASHNLTEVERIADRVLVLHAGRVTGELRPEGGAGRLEARFLEMARGWEERA